MSALLASLLAPVAPVEFRARHYGRAPLVVHGSATRLAELTALPELRSARALARVWRDKVNVWFPTVHERNATADLDPAAAMLLLERGHTLYFKQVEEFVPEVQRYLRQLELELGCPPGSARMDAFASPAGHGAPMHFDPGDTFNVQLDGEKRWLAADNHTIRAPVRGYSVRQAMGLETEELLAQCHGELPSEMPGERCEFVATPGSLVYLPRGVWHETLALTPSFAVAINLRPMWWSRLLVPRLERTLLRQVGFREWVVDDAPRSRASVKARVEQKLAELSRACAELDADALVDEVLRPIEPWQRCGDQPVELVAGEAAGDWTLLVRSEAALYELKLPRALVAPCRAMLAAARPFTLQELSIEHGDVDSADLANLLSVLAEVGLFERVPAGVGPWRD